MEEEIKKEYYDNGNLKSEGKWESLTDCTSIGGPIDCQGEGCVECVGPTKRKTGLWKYYFDNGNLKMKGSYQILRFIGLPIVKTGLWKYYYDNGNLKTEGEYKGYNDKQGEGWNLRFGVWKIYDKTGQLSDQITYQNGEVI
tara:strand:+ start:115 stop:537 length:423 start_codon:yes stop_codon:yes gene_type:complete